MHLSKKRKILSQFLSKFLKFTSNFEHCKTKVTLIAYLFPKLETAKDMIS